MKRIVVIIVAFFVSFQIRGQEDNELNKMINSSIVSYINREKDFVKQGISQRDTCLHYVCKDGLPMGFPYYGMKNIIFFSLENIGGLPKSFQKELKKGINACFVWVKLTDNKRLIITISGRDIKFTKKKHIEVTVSDWGTFTYEYSCEKREWIFADARYGGV